MLGVSLLRDAETVYEALTRRSPQGARGLAQSTGIDGERLHMAVVWLELRGQVERGFKIDEHPTNGFSWVRVSDRAAATRH